MTEDDFRTALAKVKAKFPTVAATLRNATMNREFYNDHFASMHLEDAELGLLSMVLEKYIPEGEKFLSTWFRLSKVHEGKRIEREKNKALLRQCNSMAREIVSEGVLGKVTRECPRGLTQEERDLWFEKKWKSLEDAGVKF